MPFPRPTLFRTLLCGTAAVFLAGCGMPSFLVTPVYPSTDLQEVKVDDAPKDAKGAGGKVAIIELSGLIVNAKTGGLLAQQENPVNRFVEALNRAAEDDEVKAVVLRINSPGGSVSASDTMYEEVRRFKAKTKKPVISYVQDIGASGAYYVACATDEIIVQPSSIVGSIGVIFESIHVEQGLSKLGVYADAIKSGPNKDAGSPFRAMTPDERAIFQNMINEYYARFKEIVQSRPIKVPDDQTAVAFDGRVFTGANAVKMKLADRTGTLHDALDTARTRGKAPRAKGIMYRLPLDQQGSIYASAPTPAPQANTYHVKIPGMNELPPGFYYLWQP